MNAGRFPTLSRCTAALLLILNGPGSAPSGAAEREVRLAFLGDSGTGEADQKAVAGQLASFAPSLVFLLGDNVYDRGDRDLFRARFDDVYAPLLSAGTRFHAALGNHDVFRCLASGSQPLPDDEGAYLFHGPGCHVEHHLAYPGFGYVEQKRYYAVTTDASPAPLAEVFVLDSNTLSVLDRKLPPSREDRAQLHWLDWALSVSRARFRIVALHHPPHSPSSAIRYLVFGGREREPGLDAQLAPILHKHQVDVVLAGHNHFYARMAPQDGVHYFVTGGGGRTVYPFDPAPGYVAAGGAFYHFVGVRITAEAFEFSVVDGAGQVRDQGKLLRRRK